MGAPADPEGFTIRGHEVSRVEALSDAVFALAMTLLIVSVEVPSSFDKLMDVVRGFPAFAVCFTILIWFWHTHYTFCRRFALQDTTTIVLNSALLFVVLFYVYPMKFVFGGFVAGLLGGPATGPTVTLDQARQLYVLYGAGFAAVWAIFALMHVHACRRAGALGLSPMERMLTRAEIGGCCSRILLAAISIAVALWAGARWIGLAGWTYMLLSVTETAHGMSVSRRARMLAATGSAGPPSGTAHLPRG